MKNILLVLFLSFLPLVIFANQTYEPKLVDYAVEGDQVTFKLDNGWFFVGEISNENKLYALDKLVGTRAWVQTVPGGSLLCISFENPLHTGYDKNFFWGYVTEEVYKQFATITNIEVNHSYFFPETRVTLSDSSCWVVNSDFRHVLESYWSIGDHVIVTRDYFTKNEYSLVNVDISGLIRRNRYKDARTVFAVPLEQ